MKNPGRPCRPVFFARGNMDRQPDELQRRFRWAGSHNVGGLHLAAVLNETLAMDK